MRLICGILYLLLGLPAFAESAETDRGSVIGLWASDGSIFEIYEANGTLYGQVRALLEPVYEEGERKGQPKTDDNNPDESLRSRPIVGLYMFSEYEFRNGQWQGKIYDPETGNTYQSKMQVDDDGVLEIRGYVGIPLFGRTARFLPVSACEEHIVTMLARIGREQTCSGGSAPGYEEPAKRKSGRYKEFPAGFAIF